MASCDTCRGLSSGWCKLHGRMMPRISKALIFWLFAVGTVCAQTPEDTATLRVYVNRVQIPVLLLDSYRHPTKPVPASRFVVSLDGVPPITPSAVRLEGDDPISLAILLDNSHPDEFLWERLADASATLAKSLLPQDRVEVYGIDGCKLRRFGSEIEPDAAKLKFNLAEAVAVPPYAKVRKVKGPCAGPITLWDSMLYIAGQLKLRKGRRILMELGNGQPAGPNEQMDLLRRLLNAGSISVFAVRHGEPGVDETMLQLDGGRAVRSGKETSGQAPINVPSNVTWAGYPLAIEAELSGGMVMGASQHSLPHTLADVISRVRGRYILEFPRPPELTAGTRRVMVTAGKTRDFIRPAGIAVPVATAAELAKEPQWEQPTVPVREAVGASNAPAAAEEPKEKATRPVVVPTPAHVPSKSVAVDPLDITDEVQRAAPPR